MFIKILKMILDFGNLILTHIQEYLIGDLQPQDLQKFLNIREICTDQGTNVKLTCNLLHINGKWLII